MYWDFTPSKILEHFGFKSTRQTAAKFKSCKELTKESTCIAMWTLTKATVKRVHAADLAKSALKLTKAQGSCT
jgi:hypothetical protein